MVLLNFLNHCVLPQALGGQVDNQKNASGNAHILSCISLHSGFAAGLSGTRGNKRLMRNVGTAKTAR